MLASLFSNLCLLWNLFQLSLHFYCQGDANRSYSDDDHSSSDFDESEKHNSSKLSGEKLDYFPSLNFLFYYY